MPYEINWEENGIYVRNYGDLTEDEYYAQVDETNSDPRIEKICYMIWDGLNIDHFYARGSSTLVPAIADSRLSEKTGPIKLALIAIHPHIVGLCRHYMQHMNRFSGEWEIKLFDDLPSARNWVSPTRKEQIKK